MFSYAPMLLVLIEADEHQLADIPPIPKRRSFTITADRKDVSIAYFSKLDVWQRLFEKVRITDPARGMVFLDGTTTRAYRKAAGAAKKGDTGIVRRLAAYVEAFGTKVCVSANGHGKALPFMLSPDQAY